MLGSLMISIPEKDDRLKNGQTVQTAMMLGKWSPKSLTQLVMHGLILREVDALISHTGRLCGSFFTTSWNINSYVLGEKLPPMQKLVVVFSKPLNKRGMNCMLSF